MANSSKKTTSGPTFNKERNRKAQRCCSPAPSESHSSIDARKFVENHAIEASGGTACWPGASQRQRALHITARVRTSYGRSFWQADQLFRCDAAPPLLRRSSDWSTANAFALLVSESSRICADVAIESFASLHHNDLSDRILWHSPQAIFTPIFQNQSNCLG